MARKMLETDWVLPMHDYGIPFLAKPPLWAWMSAASMGIFGVMHYARPLPLRSDARTLATGTEASRRASCPPPSAARGFSACTVMTDPASPFRPRWSSRRSGSQSGTNKGSGAGCFSLAAGLACLPRVRWRSSSPGCRCSSGPCGEGNGGTCGPSPVPWIGGSLLTLAIAAPWYALAQIRAPLIPLLFPDREVCP